MESPKPAESVRTRLPRSFRRANSPPLSDKR